MVHLPESQLEEQMDTALHQLCQPLTVLQCRLALGDLAEEPKAMKEAIRDALVECARLNQAVQGMRQILQRTNDARR